MQLVTGSLQCVTGPKGAGDQHTWDSCLSSGLTTPPSPGVLFPHSCPAPATPPSLTQGPTPGPRQVPTFSQFTHDSKSCKVPRVLTPTFIWNQLILSCDLPRKDVCHLLPESFIFLETSLIGPHCTC